MVWWPRVIPSQVKRTSLYAASHCSVATRVRSQAMARASRSICAWPVAGKLSLALNDTVGAAGFMHEAPTVDVGGAAAGREVGEDAGEHLHGIGLRGPRHAGAGVGRVPGDVAGIAGEDAEL